MGLHKRSDNAKDTDKVSKVRKKRKLKLQSRVGKDLCDSIKDTDKASKVRKKRKLKSESRVGKDVCDNIKDTDKASKVRKKRKLKSESRVGKDACDSIKDTDKVSKVRKKRKLKSESRVGKDACDNIKDTDKVSKVRKKRKLKSESGEARNSKILTATCVGKENILKEKIKEKHAEKIVDKPWIFTLKNYTEDDKFHNQEIEKSMKGLRSILDNLADSIGGECEEVYGNRKRQLVVRQCGGENASESKMNIDSIMPTVQKMRKIIHERYENHRKGKSVAHLHTEEHKKRAEEKRADQIKKQRRNRNRY